MHPRKSEIWLNNQPGQSIISPAKMRRVEKDLRYHPIGGHLAAAPIIGPKMTWPPHAQQIPQSIPQGVLNSYRGLGPAVQMRRAAASERAAIESILGPMLHGKHDKYVPPAYNSKPLTAAVVAHQARANMIHGMMMENPINSRIGNYWAKTKAKIEDWCLHHLHHECSPEVWNMLMPKFLQSLKKKTGLTPFFGPYARIG